jgi:hypothetical protein
MLPTQMRDLAQRLLAHENTAGKTSEPTEFVAFRVCETLRQPLGAFGGVAGCRSLLSRVLTLARAEAPSLSAVPVAADAHRTTDYATVVLPLPGISNDLEVVRLL